MGDKFNHCILLRFAENPSSGHDKWGNMWAGTWMGGSKLAGVFSSPHHNSQDKVRQREGEEGRGCAQPLIILRKAGHLGPQRASGCTHV